MCFMPVLKCSRKENDMSFKMRLSSDYKTGMVAVCDRCGKQVNNNEAVIAWMPRANEKPDDTMDFKILCKDSCLQAEDARNGHYTQELGAGIIFLMKNTKTNHSEAIYQAKMLEN